MYSNETLSRVVGYISIGCWIVVLFPQIWINYKRKSSDSLSMAFLYLWVIGDLLNLSGAILQHLLATMIVLAVYYTLTDIVLILQAYHYRKQTDEIVYNTMEEATPLIQPRQPRNDRFLTIFFLLVGVCSIGAVIAYFITSGSSQEVIHSLWTLNKPKQEMKLLPQIFGWASAFLYLGARVPQILKNYQSKSTEGLSLAMFCFSILGNITYSLSIVLESTDPEFLLINLSWLIGSGGTLIFDFVIFAQFYMYRL